MTQQDQRQQDHVAERTRHSDPGPVHGSRGSVGAGRRIRIAITARSDEHAAERQRERQESPAPPPGREIRPSRPRHRQRDSGTATPIGHGRGRDQAERRGLVEAQQEAAVQPRSRRPVSPESPQLLSSSDDGFVRYTDPVSGIREGRPGSSSASRRPAVGSARSGSSAPRLNPRPRRHRRAAGCRISSRRQLESLHERKRRHQRRRADQAITSDKHDQRGQLLHDAGRRPRAAEAGAEAAAILEEAESPRRRPP